MGRGRLALLLVVPLLAGCIGALDSGPTSIPGSDEPGNVTLLENDRVQVDVPVEVVLVGYDDGVADELRERLDPLRVDHSALSYFRTFPPDAEEPSLPLHAKKVGLPIVPVARYQVHDAPDAFRDRLYSFLEEDAKVNETAYGGNAAEDWLAEHLDEIGVTLDPETPTFVLLHGRDELDDHSYRYHYSNGWLGPVRTFGEREPLVVMDLSARPDPWVLAQNQDAPWPWIPPQDPYEYDRRVPAGGEETLTALERATVDATHYRLLQGSIYPVSPKPCHAITLVLAIRQSATTETLPGYRRAGEILAPDRLESGFENITGEDNVHVDTKILQLPQDDPVLAGLSRGNLGTLDTLRWWLDQNWEEYWVPHEGCEPYVSFVVVGDAAEAITIGIATFDQERSHRISFSWAGDRNRLRDMYEGPGEEHVGEDSRFPTGRDSPGHRERYEWINLFFAHETGHLMGQRHPQGITETAEESDSLTQQGPPWETRFSWSYNSVHSAMSYQVNDRTVDFGTIDRTNWARNRAGYALQAAIDQGMQDSAAFEAALDHLDDHRWHRAYESLEPIIDR